MSNGIYLVGRGKVNEGKIEAVTKALRDVIQNVRNNNPGVELYEHAIDPKTGLWTGIEKYANNAALKAHLTNPEVGAGLGKVMADLAVEGIVVMGDVNAEVKEMMAPFGATYVGDSMGFARTGGAQVAERSH